MARLSTTYDRAIWAHGLSIPRFPSVVALGEAVDALATRCASKLHTRLLNVVGQKRKFGASVHDM